jgi:hypothetical protein
VRILGLPFLPAVNAFSADMHKLVVILCHMPLGMQMTHTCMIRGR